MIIIRTINCSRREGRTIGGFAVTRFSITLHWTPSLPLVLVSGLISLAMNATHTILSITPLWSKNKTVVLIFAQHSMVDIHKTVRPALKQGTYRTPN